WFKGTKAIACQGGRFTISVPNAFTAEYLDRKQRSLIEKTLLGLTGGNISVQFQLDAGPANTATGTIRQQGNGQECSSYNPKYTFESYITGSCNRMAHSAALAAAQSPGQGYNPLFIYGGSGLGKTHLLQAIGNLAQANGVSVLYASGEQYTNDFITAIRERKMEEFRTKYRDIDLLMIDDIHFIGGKEQTEENFFHTFNELHNSNRQIVMTSDRPPSAMSLLEDRLRSRFEGGLAIDIKPPDLETRLSILKAKAEHAGVELPPDVMELIAKRIKKNVRELEGGLNRVIAYSRLLRMKVTVELATKALADISGTAADGSQSAPPTLLFTVASSFRLTPEDLTGRRRDKEVAQARQVAMFLLKQPNNCSLAEIGAFFGGRSPSTVSHACEKIADGIKASPLLRRKVQGIQRRMHSPNKG
ncbi:MAG: chromosomal replication initiator protein DnaA, partial [Dehalococcoidales bacterium]|nr:chromosomal replication initiator protein DnaA [Dehalococcoidales bacterium]